ncbi:MAG TPA: carbon starvation CstA family protein [Sedimentisphaerales bacterium]|nr:carbon starvation CstA family protein [Sedimentisphaerales bacterium]
MIILLILLAGGVMLFLGGILYAPWIARMMGEQRDRTTPAVAINDGRDYVPTKTAVVFAHHFASIAGAGPIIGPVMAILYGWGPALLWILLGGVFLGGVHDFVSTYVTMREGGKNLTVVARRYIGPGAFVMMLVLLVAILVLVCAAFLDLSATALTSTVALSDLNMESGQTLFRERTKLNPRTGQEEPFALIGGIASMSVIVITAFSPLMGFLYLKKKCPVWICSILAMAICAISILIGLNWPVSVAPGTWKLMISVYVLVAAGVPVWFFLQSRDFINVHILYAGVAFLIVALVAAGLRGTGGTDAGTIPMNNWAEGTKTLGPIWPLMFITIACGAVSGFHSLCAGGTTCKQLSNERAARRVGYWAMLLESFLAVCVVCCLIAGLPLATYKSYCYPAGGGGNAVLTFAMAVGHMVHQGLGLPVAGGALGAMLLLEGFLVTTLDTAVRLTRYMIEEGWTMLFGRYDVFASTQNARIVPAAGERVDVPRVEPVGAGGLAVGASPERLAISAYEGVPTRGVQRAVLQMLQQYWVNSGIAVALMLLLGLGNGYAVVWSIFGSANQLLAALALWVGMIWLMSQGRQYWFALVPAVFMFATSMTMLVRLLMKYLDGWKAGKSGMPALLIADVVVLTMTAGVLALTVRNWLAKKESLLSLGGAGKQAQT